MACVPRPRWVLVIDDDGLELGPCELEAGERGVAGPAEGFGKALVALAGSERRVADVDGREGDFGLVAVGVVAVLVEVEALEPGEVGKIEPRQTYECGIGLADTVEELDERGGGASEVFSPHEGMRRDSTLGPDRRERDLVDVAVLEVGEAEALVLAHGLDNGRERTALEEGWLLRELCDRHGLAQAELARRLDRTPSWVSRRLAMVGALPEAVQESVRAAEVSVQVATKILVPLARANLDACERIVRGLNGERVSVRQMTQLYVAWNASDDEVRERLCEQPRLFLKTLEAEKKPEPEDDEAAATAEGSVDARGGEPAFVSTRARGW